MTPDLFEAAWVPYSITDFEIAAQLAVGWAARQRSRSKVVAVHVAQAAGYTPTLQRFSQRATIVTPRTRTSGPRGSDVVAYVPDWKLLELATRSANSGSIVIVEDSRPVLRGWAQAVGALNLGTGRQTPDPATDDDREAIRLIHWEGNNGWGRSYTTARRMTQSALAELASAGRIDGARVLGGVFALGTSSGYLTELEQLVSEAFGPDRRGERQHFNWTNSANAPRCPMDDFPMVDDDAVEWVCRSCGHAGSSL